MNDRSIIQASEPQGPVGWIEAYMPQGQIGPAKPANSFINFDMLRGILFRQKWLIAGVVGFALVIGLVITLLTTPYYLAEAKVKVAPHGAYILEGQDVVQGVSANQVGVYLSTQLEVITSRSLAETIAADLNLGTRYDLLGKDVDESRSPNMSDAQWLEAKEKMAASILAGSVSATMPTENWIITIGFNSPDPVLAAEMANAYADAFVASDVRNSASNNQYALDYLKSQIQELRERLGAAEQASNLYARNAGIIVQQIAGDDGEGSGTTLTGANLANINMRVSAARAARIEAEQRWRSIENLPAGQLPEVQTSSLLQTLLADRTSKRTKLAELRQRYRDDFPEIVNLLAQLEILDNQIERAAGDIKSTVRNAYTIALNQERALQNELASVTGERLVEQDKQIEYGVLEREAQALRDQLKALLDRYNQINSAARVNSGAITKLDPAIVPGGPHSPNLNKNLGLALVFGLAIAGALAVLRETLDDRIRSLDDVEDRLGLPLLGHTPRVDERDFANAESNRFSALMEAYSSIRAAIDFSLTRSQNVIQLTSSQPSEGKSTTAVILAELFAGLGRKVLLIDADIRRPSVARLLDIERPKVGVVEVVLGHVPLEDAIIKGIKNSTLDILPVGEVPPNPAELLASEDFRNFIEKCRNEYSLVLIDCSPVLGLADAPLVASAADATIFVMEASKVPFAQARSALRRLNTNGAKVIGVILSKFDAREAGQSYTYNYGYYEYGSNAKES